MRKFGIEIETIGNRQRIIDELTAAGLAVNDRSSTYTGWSPTAWTVKYDGSVGTSRSEGAEIASPPLDFDDPTQRAQVDLAVKALQMAGCRPDETAGIHVHVSAADLTPKQVAATGRFFYKFEDVIYRLASSGWSTIRENGMIGSAYCKPLSPETVKGLTKVRDMSGFYKAWYGSESAGTLNATSHYDASRYHGLNLHAWSYRPTDGSAPMNTIEFRCFNSSLNPWRIQAYIALSVGIVQDAREGYSRSTAKNYRLGGMLEGTTKPEAAILRLQQVLTCDTKDSKRVISKEDWKLIRKCWADSVPQRDHRRRSFAFSA